MSLKLVVRFALFIFLLLPVPGTISLSAPPPSKKKKFYRSSSRSGASRRRPRTGKEGDSSNFSSSLSRASHIERQLQSSGIERVNIRDCNFCIKTLADAECKRFLSDGLLRALRVFKLMRQTTSAMPNLVTYSTLMSRAVKVRYGAFPVYPYKFIYSFLLFLF